MIIKSKEAIKLQDGLYKLDDELHTQVDDLTPTEEQRIIILNHMFPCDKLFRLLICAIVEEYARHYQQGEETAKTFCARIAIAMTLEG